MNHGSSTAGPIGQQPCPACGYCPCCGRQAGPVVPYVPAPVPYYPPMYPMPWNTQPVITWTWVGETTPNGSAIAAAQPTVNTVDFRGVNFSVEATGSPCPMGPFGMAHS
jgi:hypothetical protein